MPSDSITGRASHVTKLRNEFASGKYISGHKADLSLMDFTGADYDLASCGPGDLDPHAVSSVLKAFLRERGFHPIVVRCAPADSSGCLVPDPILTRDVAPAFEAALEKAKASGAMNPPPVPTVFQGPGIGPRVGAPLGPRLGLPSGPRQNSMALSRFFNNDVHIVPGSQPVEVTAPTSTTPVKPPNSLLREFNDLVQKLPRENHDLLQTIVELLARAAVHAKTTKMPLSNLLLVFCPSVGINPSVFKLMVENHEPIFDEALLPPPSPAASEHSSKDSVVYEDINATNTTPQPTPSTDYHHPRTPPQLPRIEPTGLQLDQNLSPPSIQATGPPSGAASPSELVYLHPPALSPEPKAELKSLSPQPPPPLVSEVLGPQTTSNGVSPSVYPSLTPSSSTPSSTSELNATTGLRGLPALSRRIQVPRSLQSANSQSSLDSQSSAVSMPLANPSPSVTSPPAQQDVPVTPQSLSDAPSAFSSHPLRLQTSFDKPLPNPFSPPAAAPEKAEAPSPVSSPSVSVPSSAPEGDENSGDDADSEVKPGRHQYTRVVSVPPALPELESIPPMTASFAGSMPPRSPSPPPPMPSLPSFIGLGPLNLGPKTMFTSTIAPLKIKGRGNEPAKFVPSRTGTASSTASSLGSSISRQLSPALPLLVKESASVKGDALDEKLAEISETLPPRSQLTPLLQTMGEENKVRSGGIQENTSGSEPASSLEQSRPSSAEPPKHFETPPVVPSPLIAETSKTSVDTFIFSPRAHTHPDVPITASLPTTTSFTLPPIADIAPEDVAIPEDEVRAPSKMERESPSIQELVSIEITRTRAQDHTPFQRLPLPGSLSIDEVDAVEQSASPSPSTDTLLQQEEVIDAVILPESPVVAPPQLAPPGEGRLSDDWAASVLKAATASP